MLPQYRRSVVVQDNWPNDPTQNRRGKWPFFLFEYNYCFHNISASERIYTALIVHQSRHEVNSPPTGQRW